MTRRRPDSGWRTASLAAALFAITLNFLQPLAHAALMRDGGRASSPLMAAICLPGAGQDDGQSQGQGQAPTAGNMHECCLGLARIRCEAKMTLVCTIEGNVVRMIAERLDGKRANGS